MSTNQFGLTELVETARTAYHETFGSDPQIASFAPGRVNLIGEHIDYNDGFALPMALPMGTIVMGAPNGTQAAADIITFCDKIDGANRIQFDTGIAKPGCPSWANYVKGVLYQFGHDLPGFNAVIVSNVPIGAGVSSSAALEVATLIFAEELTKKTVPTNEEKARICQKAEHTFAGTPCGIMDQMISLMAKKNHALLIDFKTLQTSQIPFMAKSLSILICNTNVRHKLSDGEYGKRRAQCTKALELMGVTSFRDVLPMHLEVLQKVGDKTLESRTKHVIGEIERTKECAMALKAGDFQKMGELMKQSHYSLRDLYEVSCNELDVIVDGTNSFPGVFGCRMTGGGFGGSTVALLETNSIDSVIDYIRKIYREKCSRECDFFVAVPSGGARPIELN